MRVSNAWRVPDLEINIKLENYGRVVVCLVLVALHDFGDIPSALYISKRLLSETTLTERGEYIITTYPLGILRRI